MSAFLRLSLAAPLTSAYRRPLLRALVDIMLHSAFVGDDNARTHRLTPCIYNVYPYTRHAASDLFYFPSDASAATTKLGDDILVSAWTVKVDGFACKCVSTGWAMRFCTDWSP